MSQVKPKSFSLADLAESFEQCLVELYSRGEEELTDAVRGGMRNVADDMACIVMASISNAAIDGARMGLAVFARDYLRARLAERDAAAARRN